MIVDPAGQPVYRPLTAIKLADGDAQSIELVSKQAKQSMVGPALTLRELEMLEELGGNKHTTIVLPWHVRDLTASLKGMEGPKEKGS